MKFLFRADASLLIGMGHVMRCMTLAEALKERGCECLFVCRDHPGSITEAIRQQGFSVAVLPCREDVEQQVLVLDNHLPSHSAWLECDWQKDAQQSSEILSDFKPDWLVVDHYALDYRWEEATRGYARRVLVIDDLADRAHSCDFLLDQNMGRKEADYQDLVHDNCRLMIGPRYALLRPEFARLRDYSLQRRRNPKLRNLLITMGGVDKDNATGKVLETLKVCRLPDDCRINVVMGANAPWLGKVREIAEQMPWPTEISVNVSDMAQRMADADLAIGAAGSTSWERCCLGLPTLIVVVADNQWAGATALKNAGAATLVGSLSDIVTQLPDSLNELLFGDSFSVIGNKASKVTDGQGTQRVVAKLVNAYDEYQSS